MNQNKNLIKIAESDNWIVEYDKDRCMYQVSYYENDGHFIDKCCFNDYEEKELNSHETIMNLYWRAFICGAAELTEFMRKNYCNSISPSEMTDVLTEFCKQFGDIKEINN